MEKNVQATNDLRTLATAYKNALSKNLKTQILSLYALNYTNEQLKKIHKPREELSDRQIKKGRQQTKENGPGLPVKKVVSHCVRIKLVKLDHFLTFIDRPYFYQDVAYRQRTLKLESGERLINHAQCYSHWDSIDDDFTVPIILCWRWLWTTESCNNIPRS